MPHSLPEFHEIKNTQSPIIIAWISPRFEIFLQFQDSRMPRPGGGRSEETSEFIFWGIDKVCFGVDCLCFFLRFGGGGCEACMTEGSLSASGLGFYFGLLWECVGGIWSCPSRLTFGDDGLYLGDGFGCCHVELLLVCAVFMVVR